MGFSSFVGALFVGLVIGVLGRLIRPGKQDIPIWLTIVVGILAAFLGTLVADAAGIGDTRGFDWIEFCIQLALSVVGVGIAAGAYGRRSLH
ncbi:MULTISPECIES: GlsB/YeaQ/YmgE family stress response membrane protein [Actinosynnema]|uniref:GlsB/YeaQ/YmgE family stress response membrane protein n=1 Tax=Actinosynnema pretiosum TaxID=42197 RepID=A0A290Z4M0_9PSEU|nr:GlsB/YeaQ/YmgE family stress response membrane protein [Actinosynnema pretiosum]ATE53967.1 GlsB/YeaQ/YmgE family stress response membrane protein [Actinosynnema pretiosum]